MGWGPIFHLPEDFELASMAILAMVLLWVGAELTQKEES